MRDKSGSDRFLAWMTAVVVCCKMLPARERKKLEKWEKENLDGNTCTGDWPGWDKYIGAFRP